MSARILLFLTIVPPASAGATIPVEGEASLLRVILDAQHAQAARWQRGRMQVKVVRETWPPIPAAEMQWESAEALVLWDGENTYWNYVISETQAAEGQVVRNEDEAVVLKASAQLIETPRGLISYQASNKHVYHDVDHSGSYPSILRMRPDQVWITYGQRRTPWRDFLDPAGDVGSPEIFIVRQEGKDRINVRRRYPGGPTFTAVVSLAHGGNVISYETDPNGGVGGHKWEQADYDWERHASGVWWLKRLEAKVSKSADPDDLESHYVLEVGDFDPDPEIPQNRFTMASFKLPEGTIVTESRKGKRYREYRIGGPAVAGDDLDRLADEARKAGFAKPD